MKYHLVTAQELTATRPSRFIPRCMVLVFVAGIVFYCVYSVIQVPVNEITSVRLTSGNTPYCDCRPESADEDRLFYNRVPKCGSTTLLHLIRRLARTRNYSHAHSRVYDRRSVDTREQRRIVEYVKNLPTPCSYDQHVFFINFTKFGVRPPLFINLVRDPVERFISSYFYRRMAWRQVKFKLNSSAEWLHKKLEHCVYSLDPECTFLEGHEYKVLLVPYFCGQEPHCKILNDRGALQRAKQNIEQYYPVVGTLEDMNVTLQVLEAVLPRFFEGVYELYQTLGIHRNQNSKKEHINQDVKDALKRNLTTDYELYHFVQQRLFYQYHLINKKVEKHKMSPNFLTSELELDLES